MISWSVSLILSFFLQAPPVSVRAFGPSDFARFRAAEEKQHRLRAAEAEVRRDFARYGCSTMYASLVAEHAIKNRVSPRLLAALIYVESSCRPRAVSEKNAVGLMQVVPSVGHASRQRLFDPDTNLRVGASIVAREIRKYGVRDGLRHYYGIGKGCDEYADKVLAAEQRR